jgi:hypothetical protein
MTCTEPGLANATALTALGIAGGGPDRSAWRRRYRRHGRAGIDAVNGSLADVPIDPRWPPAYIAGRMASARIVALVTSLDRVLPATSAPQPPPEFVLLVIATHRGACQNVYEPDLALQRQIWDDSTVPDPSVAYRFNLTARTYCHTATQSRGHQKHVRRSARDAGTRLSPQLDLGTAMVAGARLSGSVATYLAVDSVPTVAGATQEVASPLLATAKPQLARLAGGRLPAPDPGRPVSGAPPGWWRLPRRPDTAHGKHGGQAGCGSSAIQPYPAPGTGRSALRRGGR